jgi:membrane fusion protein, multidrug efflux system
LTICWGITLYNPLYQIEKGLFQAAVDKAQGALERAKAAKVLSNVELQRKEEQS